MNQALLFRSTPLGISTGLLVLVALWLFASAAYLGLGVKGDWSFILSLRIKKWAALNVVGISVALATFLFQTAAQSRILTPSIMGLDSVFLLFNIVLIGVMGGSSYAVLSSQVLFFLQVILMMLFAVIVFGSLVRRFSNDINRLLLIGIALGLLIQALVEFSARLVTPEDFSHFQSVAFAQFNHIDTRSLGVVGALLVVISCVLLRLHSLLDVYRLGRNSAITLGLPYTKITAILLMLVAALVSMSTALVGPIFFFGLLVTALTSALFPLMYSKSYMVAASFIGAIALVGGQAVFEHVLGLASTLSVVIEFVGGLVFFALLLKGRKL